VLLLYAVKKVVHSFRIYIYSSSTRSLLLRGLHGFSIDTVSLLARLGATGNYEWSRPTCPRSLRGC